MKVPVPEVMLPADQLGRVHFIGIGGAGLSAIARIMLARGIAVSGSDGAGSKTLDALAALGARVHVGHAAAQVHDVDTVVVSTAIAETNPEVQEAERQGLRLLPRSAALASVMAGRRTIAVAGTHGKTTTTSLLTVALQAAGVDPTYAIGGELTSTGVNAAVGAGDLFVAEADESDGAFLHYQPFAAVVTNVDADHLDQWGTEEAYQQAFTDFVATLDPAGFLVACADDPGSAVLAAAARDAGRRVLRYGIATDDDAEDGLDLAARDVRHDGTRTRFTLRREGRDLGEVELQIPGRHYVLNALAVLATGAELGLELEPLIAGLGQFSGTRRRMEAKGTAAGVRVYDSYAHHPSEIRGDLQAAREVAGSGRLIVAFQPHLVSRTRIFGAQMAQELGAADEVVVCEIYLAREAADPQVSGRAIAEAVPLAPECVGFAPDLETAARELAARARAGDLVVTLGAGDITTVGPRVLELLDSDDA
ncbi:UDP-N-acetylmuramate--L-alanine ligase [Nocardioides sp. Bht2]|uniref:UDP-N-acetylmuramate--L-alanine ligase n=1 Tax=Nocardioides sp. Bht2 TaxID=3392297 RepID=UPI0039B39BD9